MAGLLTGPASEGLQKLFIPAVCLLIFFLGYTSQWLFNTAEYLEPGPMTQQETTIFNILLACVWLTYYKACTVPPGRYHFPPPPPLPKTNHAGDADHRPALDLDTDLDRKHHETSPTEPDRAPLPKETLPARWCKKCAAPKPLRAHHCRLCGTCIPKMDHHCPWTGTCVSLQTFPYFLRFLVYTNLALTYLHARLLWPRLRALLWDNSALPSYLGPTVPAIVHLALLALLAAFTSVALAILLITTARSWVFNQTMIEAWEQERHDAVLLRQQRGGGWWSSACDDDDGGRSRPSAPVARVEFPYDVGFFANMAQAMGTRNVLSWLDPLVGGGPRVSPDVGRGTGWEWEENGFNDREGMWPPPDPDRTRRGVAAGGWDARRRRAAAAPHGPGDDAEVQSIDARWRDPREELAAFRARQEMDLRRRTGASGVIGELAEGEGLEDLASERAGDVYSYSSSSSNSGVRGGYYDDDDEEDDDEDEDGEGQRGGDEGDGPARRVPGRSSYEQGMDGEPGWTNAEGDRLRDYGVDEDADDDDEDVPLGELLRRRRAYASKSDG